MFISRSFSQTTFFRERLLKALSISVSIADRYSLIGEKNILYVGRLVEIKNVSLLLKAFRQVNADFPDARLLIVGDGDLREDLESQVQDYISAGLIRFMGKQEGLDLLAYYNLAQIFVLPSLYEPFGTVVNEALLSGCYTLCSSIAGSACLIDEPQNGLVFDPSNESGLYH